MKGKSVRKNNERVSCIDSKSIQLFNRQQRSSDRKGTDNCAIKRKHGFEDYKNNLEEIQLENKINRFGKGSVKIDSLRKNHRELIKSNKLILKSQQKFRSKKHNVFTEEVSKIALSAKED